MATTTSPTAKALAADLRAQLGLKNSRSKCTAASAFTVLGIRVNDADMPEPVRQALYGIAWARRTGRVSLVVEEMFQGLSDWQWCAVIADVAASPGCSRGISGEVPYYLEERFGQ